MLKKYGKENLTRCAADAKIGPASMSRIKEQKTAVGFDVLESLATLFNIEPYVLLMPGLGVQTLSLFENVHGMRPDQVNALVKISATIAEQPRRSSQ